MIANLGETTRANQEQDWLNSNMARFTGMLQGERDLETVSRLIMSELTPLVGAQHGAFFMMESPDGEGDDFELRLISSYGYKQRKNVPTKFKIGEGARGPVGARAEADPDHAGAGRLRPHHLRVSARALPVNVIVLPVLFEEQVMAVVELASFQRFSAIQQTFLEQLSESIGVVLNTIQANMRTEELLEQSQQLTGELQSQSEELQAQQEELQQTNKELEEQAASLKASEELLQTQQEELQQTNEELEEKAELLEEQNRRIEIKNREIELARAALEEKAEQLALSSRYKSEFLANMSHELRTPLNSLLILAKLLAENPDENLSTKQIEFADTIYSAGSDLLGLINDILDLSKVEAGRMDVNVGDVKLSDLRDFVERSFRPVSEDKSLGFEIEVHGANVPPTIETDEQRLQQVLKNLLSNAFKFTETGQGRAARRPGRGATVRQREALAGGGGARVRRARHGGRHPARQAAPDLRGVPAGRRDDEPALRRDRARALDQPRDRASARRRDPRRQRSRRRQHLHALPAGTVSSRARRSRVKSSRATRSSCSRAWKATAEGRPRKRRSRSRSSTPRSSSPATSATTATRSSRVTASC